MQMVEALVDDEVDLVDQNPLMDLALVALEQHLAVLHKEVNDLAAGPAVVFQGQIQRHLIVADRDQRLHAVGNDRVDEVIVELQALLVGRGIIPVGKMRAQLMEVRRLFMPVPASSLMSSL